VGKVEQITSFQNSKIKQIKKLRNRRERDKAGLFVIDDGRDLSRALSCDYAVAYALFCPALATTEDRALLKQLPQHNVYEVAPAIMEKAAYRQNPSALLAVMEQKSKLGKDDLLARVQADDSPVLVLVNLQKPGNIGALLRTADAAGFKTICLVDTALDVYNPNVIRSSTGACFLDNIIQVTTAEALDVFQSQEVALVAAVVDGDSDLFQADFRRKVAVVLGTEDQGLDKIWHENADLRVTIPMMGQLSDSLNVSVSGAIFMYEVLRQRRLARQQSTPSAHF
jgi:RNA methyltransferase, TrmH family